MKRESRRQQILDAFRTHVETFGGAPTCRELGESVGMSAPGAWNHLQALIREGTLMRLANGKVMLPGRVDLSPIPTERLRGELARRGVTMDALDAPAIPMRSKGRYCAADGCGERVTPGKLMCRRHWFQLPRDMRAAILSAWSARRAEPYQEAVEAARNYLGGFTRVVERVE